MEEPEDIPIEFILEGFYNTQPASYPRFVFKIDVHLFRGRRLTTQTHGWEMSPGMQVLSHHLRSPFSGDADTLRNRIMIEVFHPLSLSPSTTATFRDDVAVLVSESYRLLSDAPADTTQIVLEVTASALIDEMGGQTLSSLQGGPCRGASKTSVDGLDTHPFDPQSDGRHGECCTICTDDFSQGVQLTLMPCSHFFHSHCISIWLQNNNTCPLCRFQLDD